MPNCGWWRAHVFFILHPRTQEKAACRISLCQRVAQILLRGSLVMRRIRNGYGWSKRKRAVRPQAHDEIARDSCGVEVLHSPFNSPSRTFSNIPPFKLTILLFKTFMLNRPSFSGSYSEYISCTSYLEASRTPVYFIHLSFRRPADCPTRVVLSELLSVSLHSSYAQPTNESEESSLCMISRYNLTLKIATETALGETHDQRR